MNIFKLAIIITAGAIFAIACGQSATTPNVTNTIVNSTKPANIAPPAPPQAVDDVAMAKDLYATNCMTCHKDSGKGGKMTVDGKSIEPNDLTTAKMAAKTDEKLTQYIVEGFPDDGMPAFKDKLTADQMKLIVKHLRSFQKS